MTTPPSTGSTGLLAVTRHRERVGESRADGRRLRGAAGDGRHREALALEGADVNAADARLEAALVGRRKRQPRCRRRSPGCRAGGGSSRSGRHSCPGSPAPGRPRRRGCRQPHSPARPSRRCRSGCTCPKPLPTMSLLPPKASYCRRRSCSVSVAVPPELSMPPPPGYAGGIARDRRAGHRQHAAIEDAAAVTGVLGVVGVVSLVSLRSSSSVSDSVPLL